MRKQISLTLFGVLLANFAFADGASDLGTIAGSIVINFIAFLIFLLWIKKIRGSHIYGVFIYLPLSLLNLWGLLSFIDISPNIPGIMSTFGSSALLLLITIVHAILKRSKTKTNKTTIL